MSELYGARGLPATSAAAGEDITAKYEAYFAAFFAERGGNPTTSYRSGMQPAAVAASTPEQIGAEHAAACQRMAAYCESKGSPAAGCCSRG